MNLVDELKQLVVALEGAGVPYALCGGLAVTIHGAPRTTKDIDLLIEEDDVERALEALRPLGWKFRAAPMTFGHGTDHPRRIHRVSKLDGPEVLSADFIQVEPGHGEVWAARQRIDLPDGPLWVVSLQGLASMKRRAARPQDIADLQRLGLEDEE